MLNLVSFDPVPILKIDLIGTGSIYKAIVNTTQGC